MSSLSWTSGGYGTKAEGLIVDLQMAEAEALPFADDGSEAIVSTFSEMFVPNQIAAADGLLRVRKPSGKLGMANWGPDGLIGRLC